MNNEFKVVPFDLKYKDKIESGEYLVTTRGDNPVRIICWDKLDPDYPIIGLQRIGNFEFLENYNKYGRVDLLIDNDSDLMVLIDNEPLFVDLGLPSSLKWATRNIDLTQRNGFAKSQYQYECSFFSWGNTEGHNPISKKEFDYDWGISNSGPYASTYGSTLTAGAGLSDDFGRFNLGGEWRLPTIDDFAELLNSTYTKFVDANGTEVSGDNKLTTINGITGICLMSKANGKTIFFPCSGYGYDTSWLGLESRGFYWSSSLYSSAYGWDLSFYDGGVYPQGNNNRFYGFSVRPVQ